MTANHRCEMPFRLVEPSAKAPLAGYQRASPGLADAGFLPLGVGLCECLPALNAAIRTRRIPSHREKRGSANGNLITDEMPRASVMHPPWESESNVKMIYIFDDQLVA
jgi:hypothetical protein